MECHPNETALGMGACPWMVRKPVEQGAKVRRLLDLAPLDRRLAWTPPISMDSISSVDTHLTISFNAHCLETRVSSILEAAWLTICVSLLQTSSQKASGCPVPRDQSFFWITRRPSFSIAHPASLINRRRGFGFLAMCRFRVSRPPAPELCMRSSAQR